MGGKRGRVSVGSNSDRQTLNQLLACMDGFHKNEGVIVIGESPRCQPSLLSRRQRGREKEVCVVRVCEREMRERRIERRAPQ
jgi:ATP-dependent Zn protease